MVHGSAAPATVTVEIPKDLLDRYNAIWARIVRLDARGKSQSMEWWGEHEDLSEVRDEIMDAIVAGTRAGREEAHDGAA